MVRFIVAFTMLTNGNVFFLCFISLLLTVTAYCPWGWLQADGLCFHFSNRNATWTEAINACRSEGGMLVEPRDQRSVHFISLNVQIIPSRSKQYYIGGTDTHGDNHWTWHSSGTPILSMNWGPGEPSDKNHHENCLAVMNTGQWNDVPCNTPLTFICQKPELQMNFPVLG